MVSVLVGTVSWCSMCFYSRKYLCSALGLEILKGIFCGRYMKARWNFQGSGSVQTERWVSSQCKWLFSGTTKDCDLHLTWLHHETTDIYYYYDTWHNTIVNNKVDHLFNCAHTVFVISEGFIVLFLLSVSLILSLLFPGQRTFMIFFLFVWWSLQRCDLLQLT